jgi:acetylornithine deacetylase
MKGGLAAALFAAKAIREAEIPLKGRLILESVIGEEDGGMGTLATILRGHRADGAIIMEPTNLSICPVQAGSLNFRITIPGRSAHGCIRQEGVSALEKLWLIHQELLALEAQRNHNVDDPLFRSYRVPFPLSVGTVSGGEWASTVPDRVVIEGRYGLGPGEDEGDAVRVFESAVRKGEESDLWLRENPATVEWWGGRFLPARTSLEDELVRVLQETTGEVLGSPAELEGVPFGSDLRLLVLEGGIPTVLFGPGDIRKAHAADEAVSVPELEKALKTLTIAAIRYCGCEDD